MYAHLVQTEVQIDIVLQMSDQRSTSAGWIFYLFERWKWHERLSKDFRSIRDFFFFFEKLYKRILNYKIQLCIIFRVEIKVEKSELIGGKNN